MSVLNFLIKRNFLRFYPRVNRAKTKPLELQEKTFKRLISRAKKTDFGKKHNFENIKTYSDYTRNVPIASYNDLKGDIERMMLGESNVLWPGRTKWFSKSSGTTSDKSKFIPISYASLHLCHLRGGLYLLSNYFKLFPKSKMFKGKSLALGGSKQKNDINPKAITGDLSSILIANTPFWVESFRTPHKSIALMEDWDEKLELMARSIMDQDVTNLSGVPSWMLILLKRIIEIKGVKTINEVWPNLELFLHGGVNFAPYVEQFNAIVEPGSMFYLNAYNASEGFFAFQDTKESDDMLLLPNVGVFYEFIRPDELGSSNAKAVSLADVELNTNYAILISTNAGLWRYIIGDTVMFTNLHPFRIKITGRTANFINAFGEEVIMENAEKAISEACKITNAKVSEYTAGPIYQSDHSKAAHEWLIEFEQEPQDMALFEEILDKTLKSVNSDYEAKRASDILLQKPIIRVMPQGTFLKWMKERNKLGGQYKVPRLANNRKHIEEILKLNE